MALDRRTALQQNLTPNGKEIGIRPIKGTALMEIAYKDGGDLPADLKGSRYTRTDLAQEQIDSYLNRLWDVAEGKVEREAKQRRQSKAEATKAEQDDATKSTG